MLVNNTAKIYVGTNEITKVYAGTIVVYEKQEPTPYTPLTYIKSSGTQYIDTGFTPTSNKVKVKIKFRFYNTTSTVIGSYAMSGGYKTIITIHENKYYFTNYNPSSYRYNSNEDYDVEVEVTAGTDSSKTGTFTITDNVTGNVIGTGNRVGAFPPKTTTYTNMYLFTQHNGNRIDTNKSTTRLYYCKIYDNDELKRDFIPVLDENNVACLYDKVSQTYFYNSGTGTFEYE